MEEYMRLRARDIGVITDGMFGAFPEEIVVYQPPNLVVPTESMERKEIWGSVPIGKTNYMSFPISNLTQVLKKGEEDPVWRNYNGTEAKKQFGWHRGYLTLELINPEKELVTKLRSFGFEEVPQELSNAEARTPVNLTQRLANP